ncbi:tagatose 1,6-diphosphate aldolase [Fusarium sporotrichioides]|uniref:Fructose-bisphosphate aldolase n=1 Tax=Fusarium sporotrichioides TaxID=5514 RepID=A0A395S0T6_FUSSP|nr:tagatose 1,6-diphosphate aldolase [Fusarium sporotrichioides]
MTRIRRIWNSQLQSPEGMTDVQLVPSVLFSPLFFHVQNPKCTFPVLYYLVHPELASQSPASLVGNEKFEVSCTYPLPIKDNELRQHIRTLEAEQEAHRKLIALLRSRDHGEASLILDLLRHNTSIHGNHATLGARSQQFKLDPSDLERWYKSHNVEYPTATAKEEGYKRYQKLFSFTLYQLGLLSWAASAAIKSATVPLSLHLNHSQDVSQIETAGRSLSFESIMVGMSYYYHGEILARSAALANLCHEWGVAVEAKIGRISDDEDGSHLLPLIHISYVTKFISSRTPREAEDFLKAGVDILAPSVGNIHDKHEHEGPNLDLNGLRDCHPSINKFTIGR